MRACAEIWRRKPLHFAMSMMRQWEQQRQLCFGAIRPFHTYTTDQEVTGQVSPLQNSYSTFQRRGFFSFSSQQNNEKETAKWPEFQQETKGTVEKNDAGVKPSVSDDNPGESGNSDSTNMSQTVNRRRRTRRTTLSDSDTKSKAMANLSREDMVKLIAKKEELLKTKHKEREEMQEKVLRNYAEMENIMERTKREAENSKKFALQNFAKSLLDVADNLGRASSAVKDKFVKLESSEDRSGALPLLKTLLEGVEMTEKQLQEVFKKFGVEKYHPVNEVFDPSRHNAAFRVTDPSKPPDTVAVVLKPGYLLHERIIRPAEVGVTVAGDP